MVRMVPWSGIFIYICMQVRKASLLLIMCSLLFSITALICSFIAQRTPFSSQGFETSNIDYLCLKYSKSSLEVQWIMFIHDIISMLLEMLMSLLLLLKIIKDKPISLLAMFLILSQMIMSQSVVAGYRIAIPVQIGYSEGITYVDIMMTALSVLTLLLQVIVLVINLYNFTPQPKLCIEKAPIISKQYSIQLDKKEKVKGIKQIDIEEQQIQAFQKNRPTIIPAQSPMATFFEGLGQPAKLMEVQSSKSETNRKSKQNRNNLIESDFTIQPLSLKKAGRGIKIPRLDLNKVKNANIVPQTFFPSFAAIDISVIHPQKQNQNHNSEYNSALDSEVKTLSKSQELKIAHFLNHFYDFFLSFEGHIFVQ